MKAQSTGTPVDRAALREGEYFYNSFINNILYYYNIGPSAIVCCVTLVPTPRFAASKSSKRGAWRWTEFDRTSGLADRINQVYEDREGNLKLKPRSFTVRVPVEYQEPTS